jgi:hypothetical protein
MRAMMRLLLPAALLLPGVALAAEDWRAVEGLDGVPGSFWIDMDSVRVESGITHFRTRVKIEQFEGFAYVDSIADCAGKTAEMRRMELIRDGTVVKAEDYPAGSRTKSLDDAEGAILMKMICK